MSTQNTPPTPAGKQDAIDINDFVYAATGARVRRLTMPDGTHWFPAVDVARHLGYANTRQAVNFHVADDYCKPLRDIARGVCGVDTLRIPAGQGLQKSMNLVNLQGLVQLVNGSTKPAARPFKRWVAEVVLSVQRDGSYELEKAEVQPSAPDAPTAYAMPKEVADAIVRLEEHNLSMDAQMLAMQRETQELRRESVEMLRKSVEAQRELAEAIRESTAVQRESFTAGQTTAQALMRSVNKTAEPPRVTPASLIAEWRERNLVVTADIWAVAAYILPSIIEHGECLCPLDAIASVTGLAEHRVHDALRMLQKRGCVRQTGVTPDGAPVYVLK